MINRYRQPIVLGLIIIFYLFNGIVYLRGQSITSDESSFMDYAIRYLKGNPDRVRPRTDNSKMPIIALNTIPRVGQEIFSGKMNKADGGFNDLMNGRHITLIFSVLTILLVYLWSKQLYGESAGLLGAFLMSICPNNLSHAALVTTDSYSVFFLLASFYCLWKYCKSPVVPNLVLLSVVTALSQLVKQSLFHLYILIPLCILIYTFLNKQKIEWKKALFNTFIFLLINLVIINAGYYFSHSFQPLGDYHFMSNLFQQVQQNLPGFLPLPFPAAFVEGLDMAKYYDQVGGGIDQLSSFGNVTILGMSGTGEGFWYYYLVSLFFKTPVPMLILFAWSLFILLKEQKPPWANNSLFLLMPVIYFLIIFSFFYKTQCGLRHIIFIYPFLFIISSSLVQKLSNYFQKLLLTLLLLWTFISVMIYWGNYIPYTNELIPDKKNAYKKVGVSNLEYQQGYYFALDYMQKHHEVKWAPTKPAKGIFIINLEDYQDIWNRHRFDWLRTYQPAGHVAYNYILLNIPVEPKQQDNP